MNKEPFANLPDVLNANQLAEALHLSKAGAYNLLNADTIRPSNYYLKISIFPNSRVEENRRKCHLCEVDRRKELKCEQDLPNEKTIFSKRQTLFKYVL